MMPTSRWRRYIAVGLLCLIVGGSAVAAARARFRPQRSHRHQHTSSSAVTVDFTRDIQPILVAQCVRCHGATRHQARLRLDSAAALRRGGASGAVIVTGDSAQSLLVALVTEAEEGRRMPPSGRLLDAKQVALLKAWINQGAPAPPEEEPESFDHWAFRPLVRPALPCVQTAQASRNPIDAFLAAEQEKHGLSPAGPIAPSLWLRRVTLDLTGLPPSRADMERFLTDPSETAYERVVDQLLASPQYGERWGRHWMDIWRYSDPDGRKSMNDIWWSNELIWRWRDWIVRSLNADKGYERMILEMLAGDELVPHDADALIATGFLVRSWFKHDRNVWLHNTVEHTSKAFLGLTLHCARCHNHKFDPITQEEFYCFRAFFEPYDVRTERVATLSGASITIAHAHDAHPDMPTWLYIRGDVRMPNQSARMEPGVPTALGGPRLHIEPILESPGGRQTSTGRRLALARWLCDPRNPLTARVAVNHVWARHFGEPLVEHVADFGLRSPAPTHQALLDWLAVEFIEHGWSMKWLHRLIVTSDAYRRGNARRMEGEAVRDSLLSLSGALDLTMGGPPLDYLAGATTSRRSLYYRYAREDKLDLLAVFDAASVEDCYRRKESVVPQQALALENSEFVWEQAERIARRLECGQSASDLITQAFECILCRPPSPAEREACERFLAHQEQLLAKPDSLTPFLGGDADPEPAAPCIDARTHLIHALLNHHDFITIR